MRAPLPPSRGRGYVAPQCLAISSAPRPRWPPRSRSRPPRAPPRSARRVSATRSSRSPATAATTSATTRWRSTTTAPATAWPARTTITATATQALDRFDLDLRGFDISRLDVNGAPATFTRDGQELQITPRSRSRGRQGVHRARRLRGHAGVRHRPRRLDRRAGSRPPTARSCVNEPQGTPTWFPVNDNPRDKATYDFAITVPGRDHGARERRAALLGDQRRQDHVGVARELADGAVPRDRDQRPVQPLHPDRSERPADLQRHRREDRLGEGAVAALQGARDRVVLQRSLRRVPVRGGRRDHRPAARRRLLARGADQAGLRVRARRDHGRPRALAHVVRRRRDGQGVARPVAARGVRHVLGVDLDRAPRRPDGTADVRRSATRTTSSRGARRRTRSSARRSCSRPRSTTAAG